MVDPKPCSFFQRLVLTLAIFTCIPRVHAQVEHLATLASSERTMTGNYSFPNGTNIVIVQNNWNHLFWKLNTSGGSPILLDSIDNFSVNSKVIQTESGLFYLSSAFMPNGNDLQYFINHIDLDGVKHVSPSIYIQGAPINTIDLPKLLAVRDSELFYILNNQNGTYKLFKNNLALNAQTSLFTFDAPLHTSFIANDSLIVVTKGTGDYKVYNCSASGVELRLLMSAPIQTVVGQKDNETFLSVYESGRNTLWKSDFTSSGTARFIDSIHVGSIHFEGNSFILKTPDGFWKGDYDHPENRTKIPFAPGLDAQATYIDMDIQLPPKLVRLLTYRHGVELGKLENDTIRLADDLFEGAGTGWTGKKSDPDAFYNLPYFTYLPGADSLYTIMTNGNDSLQYLYLYDGTDLQSYFPMNRPREIIWMKADGDYAYWLRSNSGGLYFQRRSLNANLEPQPTISIWPDSSLTWTNNLGYTANYHGFWSQDINQEYNDDYNAGCKLTSDGGVITCFTLRHFLGEYTFTDDGYFSDSLNACIVFCKYDKYGKVTWTRSIGGRNTMMFKSPCFTVDPEGNILVAGPGFEKVYFGSDSLTSPRGMNFLAKINGATGQILWKKLISESYYVDDVLIEGIVLDEQNAIYLSAYFKGFSCMIGGAFVQAQQSPSNAIAKFSSDGNIELLKGTPTPWKDFGGDTKVFAYNQETQEVISCQTQGAYNVSSSCAFRDWNYFTQVIDADGNAKRQKSFITNDIGSLTTGVTHGTHVIGFGYFRGTLDMELFSETTQQNGCHVNEGFMYTYSQTINQFTSLKTTISEPFYPLDSKSYGSHVYVYGTDKNQELVAIKFTADGQELGYLRLGQYSNPFSWGSDQFFDVDDNYLVFSGNNFRSDPTYDVFPAFGFCPYKTVVKTGNKGWKTDMKWFEGEEMIPFSSTDSDVAAFPNPFSDNITIVFEDPGFSYNKYELFDLNGKRTASGQLSSQILQVLPFNTLGKGSYLLRLSSDQKQTTLKLIKL